MIAATQPDLGASVLGKEHFVVRFDFDRFILADVDDGHSHLPMAADHLARRRMIMGDIHVIEFDPLGTEVGLGTGAVRSGRHRENDDARLRFVRNHFDLSGAGVENETDQAGSPDTHRDGQEADTRNDCAKRAAEHKQPGINQGYSKDHAQDTTSRRLHKVEEGFHGELLSLKPYCSVYLLLSTMQRNRKGDILVMVNAFGAMSEFPAHVGLDSLVDRILLC